LNADVDYEVEYNNRARVPENPAIIAGWSRDAAAYREAHQAKTIAYGPGARNRIDLFSGKGEGALVVFIHGGYWQALDGSFFSHLAAGLNAHGIDVAVPSYDLCPAVSITDIIGQMRTAMRELAKLGRPLVVSGHSAGGHLAACMLATDWHALDASLPARGTLDAVVGGNESAEYFRQSRSIVDAWSTAGIAARFATIADANHFTAIAPLADVNSPMTLRLKQLAGR
jgi:arylformamidase